MGGTEQDEGLPGIHPSSEQPASDSRRVETIGWFQEEAQLSFVSLQRLRCLA